jgi:AmmeMemoRadiSam system protein A
MDVDVAPDEMLGGPARGVFVSLHKAGGLRGCIGTIQGVSRTLGDEIVANALSAAFRDPRFPPLEADELAALHISVDVLDDAEAAVREQLDPKEFGVIVSSGHRRGLLLPALDGVDDVETQLSIALSKAGIRPGERYQIERFRVRRYEE